MAGRKITRYSAARKGGLRTMPRNRIDASLGQLAEQGRTALIPYLTRGYPDLEVTCRLIGRFDALGAAAVEIGFPFSDSIADGSVIQDSFHRVLAGGFRVGGLFAAVQRVRQQVDIPLIAMVSYSIVARIGPESFADLAAGAGFDGLITPDVPIEEAQAVASITAKRNLRHIMLVATSTPAQRCRRIVALCSGFVYQVAASGTTGERSQLADDLATNVRRLRQTTDLPICVGFGISNADQVRQAGRIADGVIIGSAIVRRITEAMDAGGDRDEVVDSTAAFVAELAKAT